MTTLAKWIRKATSLLTQSHKVVLKADDWSLEHVLVYHGLVGTSPEGSRAFKDVRADFVSAVNRGNSHNLCICLKLPPLQWEDKLQKIVNELKDSHKDALVKTLLPDASDVYEQSTWDPLSYTDWHVQANAALLLAHLGVTEAEPRLIAALDSTASSVSPAFCHIARALSQYHNATARAAISRYTTDPEPWLRVDAVSALASWPVDQITDTLQKSFEDYHKFFDYQAVSVAKKHNPADFIEQGTDAAVTLGCEIIIGTLEAMTSTFANQTVIDDFELCRALKLLGQRKGAEFNPVELYAMQSLIDWSKDLTDDEAAEADIDAAKARLAAADMGSKIVEYLVKVADQTNQSSSQKSMDRYAIKLAGRLKVTAARDALVKLLDSPASIGDAAIALGELGLSDTAQALIQKAHELVDVDGRSTGEQSAQPLDEENRADADSYWHILQALGNMPTAESLSLLLKATDDNAPDKREAALASAIKIYGQGDKLAQSNEVVAAVVKALGDPSSQVKLHAIDGAGTLNRPEPVEPLAKLTISSESSIARQAIQALENLAHNGQKSAVLTALNSTLAGERNANRTRKIKELIDRLNS